MNIQTVKSKLQELRPILAQRYDVRSLGMFGSRVRGDALDQSDMDILVSFGNPPSLLRFMELENLLTDELGVKVDLVMEDALKPAISRRILAEVVPV